MKGRKRALEQKKSQKEINLFKDASSSAQTELYDDYE
jgi:hypothetical protein